MTPDWIECGKADYNTAEDRYGNRCTESLGLTGSPIQRLRPAEHLGDGIGSRAGKQKTASMPVPMMPARTVLRNVD
ncbi:hypothetical protein [Mesorhizobium sp. dw_380]|uniref:hypothetical protein n=1 Tax=Mesorhizobium sp. dw_380 TaxID=2812001 RepID=UPI001BDF04ED|nr:hypothetical protein [Mesorhizobium sp. dw_380]